MPRFFFESQDGAYTGRDEEGLEFPDRAAAESQAAETAAAMLQESLSRGRSGEVTIVLLDETGSALSSLTATLTIKRPQP
jgi:hypothetical protein